MVQIPQIILSEYNSFVLTCLLVTQIYLATVIYFASKRDRSLRQRELDELKKRAGVIQEPEQTNGNS